MIQKIIIFSALSITIVLTSCNNGSYNRKPFVWDEEVEKLTGGSLRAWLRKAPFAPEFDKYEQYDQNKDVVMTNAKQVFPFMGRYYNAKEELRRDLLNEIDTLIYMEDQILYRDSVWGDLFVAATLLYSDQEIFLGERYLEMGNPLFDGLGKVSNDYHASLSETAVFAKHRRYKTGLYWVRENFSRYLLGFYQHGQLVFETVVPLGLDTLATLNKMKEVNQVLGLNIPEWENATVAALKAVDKPKSFWEKPVDGD